MPSAPGNLLAQSAIEHSGGLKFERLFRRKKIETRLDSLAFLTLVFATMRTMARLPRIFGTLGLVILFAHYVDGLFDIFWIGANMIPPLVIVGMSLGMADTDGRDRGGTAAPSTRTVADPAGGPATRSGRSPGRVLRWARSALSGRARPAARFRPAAVHR